MKVIAYEAGHFLSQVSKKSNLRLWKDIYHIFTNDIGLVDRTGIVQFPINAVVTQECKIPTFKFSQKSYDDCCIERVDEIIRRQDITGKQIVLMYSGGVDSSTVLASFIKRLGINETAARVTLCMNRDSIDENPLMWKKYIRGRMQIISSDIDSQSHADNIVVLGELNDQLFGSDVIAQFLSWGGNPSSQINEQILVSFLRDFGKMQINSAAFWAKLLINNLKTCPSSSNTFWDVFWWYNFTWKWSYVYYRFFLFTPPRIYSKSFVEHDFFPFFATESFQNWSVGKPELRHSSSWASYKNDAKQIVCDLLGDKSYMAKGKVASLDNIFRLRKKNAILTHEYETKPTANFEHFKSDTGLAFFDQGY